MTETEELWLEGGGMREVFTDDYVDSLLVALAAVTKERDELKTRLEDQVCEAKDFAYKLEGKTVELTTVTA